MNPLSPLEISASGLEAQRIKMSVIASNLANIHSTRKADGSGPYRRRDVVLVAKPANNFQNILNENINSLVKVVEVEKIVEDQSPFEKVYNPSHPDADAEGYVSLPNVSVIEEMANLVLTVRSYQANLAAIKNYRSMVNSTISLLQE